MEDGGMGGIGDIVQMERLMIPLSQELLCSLGEPAMLHTRPSASWSTPAPGIRMQTRRVGQRGAEELEDRFLDCQFIHQRPASYMLIQKTLKEIMIDYRNGAAQNLKVGARRNDQTTFTDSTQNVTSTGRATKQIFVNGGRSHGFQFRISNNSLDETADVVGVAGFAIPGRVRD